MVANCAGASLHTMAIMQMYDGSSMAALVATVGNLWFNLLGIMERDRLFLLDAPLSPSGLYGNAVRLIVERFQEAKHQSAAFQEVHPLPLSVLLGCCQRAAPAARLQLLIWPRPERECYCSSPPSKRLGVEAALSSEASEGENGSEGCYSVKKGFREEVLMPDGLVLSPRSFTKCMDAALAPLRLQGICMLNHIDVLLILAQSQEMVI